jgi:dTDP-D-glucose 4,6-dehydratase
MKPHYVECRPGDIRHSVADISRLKNDFEIAPDFDFASGLKKTVECYSRRII